MKKQTFFHYLRISVAALVLCVPAYTGITNLDAGDGRARLATYGKVIPRVPVDTINLIGVGLWTKRIVQPDTSTLRIHFKVEGLFEPASWVIQIKKPNGAVITKVAAATASKDNLIKFWSKEVSGNEVIIEIHSKNERNQLRIVVDKVAVSETPRVPQSITPPKNEMIDIRDEADPDRLQWAKSVTRLRFVGESGKLYYCTGFLVAEDLLMTNEHCPRSEQEWRSTLVDFNFDSDGANPSIAVFTEKVLSNTPLDFALYRIDWKPPEAKPLLLDATVPTHNRALLVIQHPGGESKKISVTGCRAIAPPQNLDLSASDFVHLCDTEGGSSGAGVIDKFTKKVVGLHHLGWDETQAVPKPFQINRAVKMRDIMDAIRRNLPAIANRIGIP